MMSWQLLIESRLEVLDRGSVLKFPAGYPFENEVVLMVCEEPESAGLGRALMAITGYKAGINCHVIFPRELMISGLKRNWLVQNWINWVYPEGDVRKVLVKRSLEVKDIQ